MTVADCSSHKTPAQDGIAIKEACMDDAAAIFDLLWLEHRTGMTRHRQGLVIPPPLTVESVQNQLAHYEWLTATAGGRIVGGICSSEVSGTCHILRLLIHPDHENVGIGARLLRELEERIPNIKRFQSCVGHKTTHKLRLLKRVGYRTFRVDTVSDQLTLVTLEKERTAEQQTATINPLAQGANP